MAYTQRALAEAKNQCAQIKKELLAALFHDFIYGREAILKLTQTSHSNRKQASLNSPWLQFEVYLQKKNRTAYGRHCHVPTQIVKMVVRTNISLTYCSAQSHSHPDHLQLKLLQL